MSLLLIFEKLWAKDWQLGVAHSCSLGYINNGRVGNLFHNLGLLIIDLMIKMRQGFPLEHQQCSTSLWPLTFNDCSMKSPRL